jgi:16S rRNA processing protein RimM
MSEPRDFVGPGGVGESNGRLPPAWSEMVLVGTIVRPHALRGEVIVQPETDYPEERFRPGSVVLAVAGSGLIAPRELTVEEARAHLGRLIVAFAGVTRIEDAEELRGTELRVAADQLTELPPGRFYYHDLIGCEVVTTAGATVGRVVRIDGGGTASLLAVRGARGEVLIPLAEEICAEIDVAARRVVIAAPEGLLDLNG